MATLMGEPVRRKEDRRLITGSGTYVDDVQLPGTVYAAFVRSPHAHARVKSIDTSAARRAPGVLAVVTGAEWKGGALPCGWQVTPDLKIAEHKALAAGEVHHVGDAVAVVVAGERAQARDAADLVVVEYEPLPAVIDLEEALQPGAPLVHSEMGTNVAYVWKAAGGDVEGAFAGAERIVKLRIVNQRIAGTPIEPRACLASYEPAGGNVTLWTTTQMPYVTRTLLALTMGISEAKLRVVAPEVGGGFGVKLNLYAEEQVIPALAMQLKRPVKWVEERREHMAASIHGRDQIDYVEAACKADGTVLAMKWRVLGNMGGYLQVFTPGIPLFTAFVCNGAYRVPAISFEAVGIYTTTTPTDATRGAGRPEATHAVERLMDAIADDLGLDPADVRRRNFIRPEQFPFTTPFGIVYDSGQYEAALNKALQAVDYAGLKAEQARRRAAGDRVQLGIGLSSYVEICGLGPSQAVRGTGLGAPGWESATLRVSPTGKVTVVTGSCPTGQGHETAWSQLVASRLGCSFDDVEVLHGDTGLGGQGMGTYGSRSVPVGGGAIFVAAQKLIDKGRRIAAHQLECSVDDLVFEGGRYTVKGSPDRGMGFGDVALQAWLADKLPPGEEPGLEQTVFFDPPNFTFPFGTHICVAEVDTELGTTRIRRYLCIDDCGNVINPMIVDGQVHGGVVMGLAQAFYEQVVYDKATGQLLTPTFVEYGIPSAMEMPRMETDRTVTPTPSNPLGAKGIGEAGTIAASPAAVNAVVDALSPLGIRDLDMPMTPDRVWQAIQQAKGGR